MELRKFLNSPLSFSAEQPISSVCFQKTQEYPFLFFSLLVAGLKKRGHAVVILGQEVDTVAAVQMRLETTFLGTSSLYVLRSFVDMDKKMQQQLLTYLRTYEGPHTIFIAVSDEATVPSSWNKVTMPEAVDRALFLELMQWSGNNLTARATQGIDSLYARTRWVSLDTAVLLIHYFKTVGSHQQQFIDAWLDYIVEPDKSLFTLSQYFFAKDQRSFFKAWKKISSEYSESFWISFWSEQVWRAFFYVQLMHMHKVTEAKKIAYRLPFSFIQRDWKKVKPYELKQIHTQLYALDYALKNGSGTHGLDLLFSQFFLH